MAANIDEDELFSVESDDYYSWLCLNTEATTEEVNSAFRSRSRSFHPDKAGNDNQEEAQLWFTRIKEAHNVLSNPITRALYDEHGKSGVQKYVEDKDKWVVKRSAKPQEILEEAERQRAQREEQRLNQKTNPKVSTTVGFSAVELFEPYEGYYEESSSIASTLSKIEMNRMETSCSVDMPLDENQSCSLGVELQGPQNGGGGGVLKGSYRRNINQSWAEGEVSIGSKPAFSVRCFKNLWRRAYCISNASISVVNAGRGFGFKPSCGLVLAQTLDSNLIGRLQWNCFNPSSMATSINWEPKENHHVNFVCQVGRINCFLQCSYIYKITAWDDAKLKFNALYSTFGGHIEYGMEKKVTKFSRLGAMVTVSTMSGVLLKLKVIRGHQTFSFPIQLSEEILPGSVFYATFLPPVMYCAWKYLLYEPWMQHRKRIKLQKLKDEMKNELVQRKRDAASALKAVEESVKRSLEIQNKKNGLIIQRASYGKIYSTSRVEEDEVIDVTSALQALVENNESKLDLRGRHLSGIPGFYDPCVGEDKQLNIVYVHRGKAHAWTFNEDDPDLWLPNRKHLQSNSTSSSSSSSSGGQRH